MADDFNGEEFIKDVEPKLSELGDIASLIMKKKSKDMGIIYSSMTPKQADQLMTHVEEALESFVGTQGRGLLHRIIKRCLKRHAPEYFDKAYGI